MTLTLTTSGGIYTTYLRASNDALAGPAVAGTFYAVEVQNPTFNSAGLCTATLVLYKQQGGITAQLFSTTIACRNG